MNILQAWQMSRWKDRDVQCTQWGVECWELGHNWFEILLNDGRPVDLVGLQGNISAGPLPHAKTNNGYVRQTLMSLTYSGPRKKNNAEVVASPDNKRHNHNVSRNFAGFNIKSVGTRVVHISVDRVFLRRHRLEDGKLRMKLHNASYDGRAPTTDPKECLNVESHLSVYWSPARSQTTEERDETQP